MAHDPSVKADEFDEQPWQVRWPFKRFRPDPRPDIRDKAERDRARILHSASFRRLQSKTQILGVAEGDFHRTRLTHTMEVASIALYLRRTLDARLQALESEELDEDQSETVYELGVLTDKLGLAKKERAYFRSVLPSEALIEAVAFCHDLGHPPFGHAGEEALDEVMRSDGGGFEGNGQSLRNARCSHLEATTSRGGLGLTRRVFLGFLKYPVPYSKALRRGRAPALQKPPKCYLNSEQDLIDWILEPFKRAVRRKLQTPKSQGRRKHFKPVYRSLDASIMDLADDITNAVHDIEDAIHLKILRKRAWNDYLRKKKSREFREWWSRHSANLEKSRSALGEKLFAAPDVRKKALGGMINALVLSVRVKTIRSFSSPLLRYNVVLERTANRFLSDLKKLTRKHVHTNPWVVSRNEFGKTVVRNIFEACWELRRQLFTDNEPFAKAWQKAGRNRRKQRRVVCDYVANMSDSEALEFNRLRAHR